MLKQIASASRRNEKYGARAWEGPMGVARCLMWKAASELSSLEVLERVIQEESWHKKQLEGPPGI